MKGETKRKEDQANEVYRTALRELDNADVLTSKILAAVALIRDELNDGELAESVRR